MLVLSFDKCTIVTEGGNITFGTEVAWEAHRKISVLSL